MTRLTNSLSKQPVLENCLAATRFRRACLTTEAIDMSKHKQVEVMQSKAAGLQSLKSKLHLLDLDRHDEWPSIPLDVLSTKDTGPNQKARIQCVEWILYRLFEIWDPEEAADVSLPQ